MLALSYKQFRSNRQRNKPNIKLLGVRQTTERLFLVYLQRGVIFRNYYYLLSLCKINFELLKNIYETQFLFIHTGKITNDLRCTKKQTLEKKNIHVYTKYNSVTHRFLHLCIYKL